MMRQYGGVVSDADVAIVKNALAETNNELEKAKRPRDLWDVMGFKLDDEQKQAISESVSFALEQMTAILDAEIEMAQQAVDAANERVTAAQSALDAEMQAKANGLAYSQTEAEKRLALEKRTQAKAIAEQKRVQKQRQAIDTLTQTTSLITATAQLWNSFAGTGPAAPFLAAAAIAAMWASFGVAKSRLLSLPGVQRKPKNTVTVPMSLSTAAAIRAATTYRWASTPRPARNAGSRAGKCSPW